MRLKRILTEGISDNRTMFILSIVLFQLAVDVAVVYNIPVARQVLGFVYLTFVVGVMVLRLLGMSSFDSAENLLFSIGLSIAFVMFLGLVVNQIGLSFRLAVLSTPALLLAMNIAVFFLCPLCYYFGRYGRENRRKVSSPSYWILTVFFPFLAVLGTAVVNATGNSQILLLMIGLVALTVMVISTVRNRTNLPITLFMITIAVLLQTSLISNYIVGYDVHPAYHVFKTAQDNQIWNAATNETDPLIPRTNQMLSVTIFPVVYSDILNLEGTWIFKIVYPLILALVPAGLYLLYKKYAGEKTAFIAAFFILASITFIAELPGLPAQIISEFFLALLLILLFEKDLSQAKKIILFAIFSMGTIVSHYGVSYIFMFLIFFSWLFLSLRKKQTKIKINYVILFFVLAFSWYIYTAQSASFDTLVEMGQNVSRSFWIDLLNPQSRTETALTGVGLGETAVSLGHWIGRIVHYGTQLFIILGVIGIFLKKGTTIKFDYDYTLISLFMLVFALSPLIAPSFNLLNVPRTYHLSLLFLAPFCIIGGNLLFSIIPRRLVPERRKRFVGFMLTSLVVTSLFLFESGFVYEVTRDVSYSVPLSKYRMSGETTYGHEYISVSWDVFGAVWLRSNIDVTANTLIYGDLVSIIKSPLTSYALLPPDHMKALSNVTAFHRADEYVYLRNFNTQDDKVIGESGLRWNTTDLAPIFNDLNKIYTNGGSEIFATQDNKTNS